MYLQRIILKLPSSNLAISVLPSRTFTWLKSKHFQGFRRPEMSKVISRKARDPGSDPVELNKKEKYRNSQLNKGIVPRTDSIKVVVLKSGAFDGPKSVIIETPFQNYLFNCGEGTQRQLLECRVRLVQIEDIFLTHRSWENIGGLFGMLMTSAGQNEMRGTDSVIKIHGPPQVEQVLQMTKNFSESPKGVANIEKREISAGSYSNYQMDIEYVKITKSSGEQRTSKVFDEQTENRGVEGAAESSETEEPREKRQRLTGEDTDFAVAYIIKPKCGHWSMNKTKLMALKVKGGPWIKELLEGKSHTLEDGRVLTREEYGIPPKPVPSIVVLECPSKEYLESFLSSEQLGKLSTDENNEPQLIVHMSPADIVDTEEYQGFINRYKTTSHLLLNRNSKQSVVHGSIMFHQGLNNIHPGLFPEFECYKTHAVPTKRTDGLVVQGESNLRYNLKPFPGHHGFDWESCFVINREESIEESFKEANEQASELVSAWKQQLRTTTEPTNKREYPEVVFLGTGSAQPCRHRNVSGILLHLSPDKCLLMDCGEGSMEQIKVFYGDKADDVFMKLAAVFISHLHADHHLGLFGVINARREALQSRGLPIPRLPILAPIQIQRWLYLYFRIIMNLFNEIELIRHVPNPENAAATQYVHKSILDKLELEEFKTVPVNHAPNSFGVSMTHRKGWKLVYSGDTTPCKRLVEAGKGCDLLIHEASFSDDLKHEALAKNHSTTSDAIQIGREMEAKFILLNHFSQRYSRIPVFTEKFTQDIASSFDLMKVNLDTLPDLSKLKPVFESMFAMFQLDRKLKDTRAQKTSEIEALNRALAKTGNKKGGRLTAGQKMKFRLEKQKEGLTGVESTSANSDGEKSELMDGAGTDKLSNVGAREKDRLSGDGVHNDNQGKIGDQEKLEYSKVGETKREKLEHSEVGNRQTKVSITNEKLSTSGKIESERQIKSIETVTLSVDDSSKNETKDLANEFQNEDMKEYNSQDYEMVEKIMGKT